MLCLIIYPIYTLIILIPCASPVFSTYKCTSASILCNETIGPETSAKNLTCNNNTSSKSILLLLLGSKAADVYMDEGFLKAHGGG